MENGYQYPPLKRDSSIRMLELLPATNGPLACRLIPVKLMQKPEYEALSYTWGKPNFPNLLQEATSNSYFRITDNLRDALQALRFQGASRLLWVDAVCINQGDHDEKGQQVNMMKDIYQSARRVLVWLGKGSENHDVMEYQRKAFAELEDIGRNCSLYGFDKVFPPFPQVVNGQDAFEQLKKLAREYDGLGLLTVYQGEWYERVWIVQEFVLAKDLVLCVGTFSITYDLFSKATAVLRLIIRRPSILKELPINTRSAFVLTDKNFAHAWRLIQKRERYWGMSATQHASATSQRSVYAHEDPMIRPS